MTWKMVQVRTDILEVTGEGADREDLDGTSNNLCLLVLEFWGFSKQDISVHGGGLGYGPDIFIRAD